MIDLFKSDMGEQNFQEISTSREFIEEEFRKFKDQNKGLMDLMNRYNGF